MSNYTYPLDPSWSTDEIETVIHMLNVVEDAYEVGVKSETVMNAYRAFKEVIPTKSGEKQIGRVFFKKSGYQLYDVVQAAKGGKNNRILMSRENKHAK